MDLSGKIGIWGFGKEGQSLYRHLLSVGDFKELSVLLDTPDHNIDTDDITVLSGEDAIEKIQSGYFDLIFKSPGISLYRPEIEAAQANGTKFSSATNLWFDQNTRTKKIVITGTKGKSTTSSLLYHVMKESGLSVSLAGNVGIPLLDLDDEKAYTVIELSSYQLADLEYAPDVFVVLNLFPEHLQWHQNHENYYKDKLRPLDLPSVGKVIVNAQNKMLKDYVTERDIDVAWFGEGTRPHIETQLKGDHNQDNIDAVLSVCETLGLDSEKLISHVGSFKPLLHRLQQFTSDQGFVCVNDSISTTPESAIAALKVYKNKEIILILGGTDRGQDYSELIDYIKTNQMKAIALLPKNGARLAEELKAASVSCPVLSFPDLEEASQWIKDTASQETVVLLSPAAPSYDQFKNFEERGALFIKLMTA